MTKRLIYREDGAVSALGLILFITMVCVGGLGLDFANLVTVRTHLQIAADSAAHSALVTREFKSESEAKLIAVQIAQQTLPASKFGDTIKAEDIQFGKWDGENDTFRIIPGSADGVLVRTQRLASRGNAVVSYFLRFVGYQNFDVVVESVFESYYPTCFREGFVAQDRVDVQSNNLYTAGFCIHSNSHVELNNNNVFEQGVIVSMPDARNIVMPSGGFANNNGLQEALRDGAYSLRLLRRVGDIIDGFDNASSKYYRSDYLNQSIKKNAILPSTDLDESVWKSGEIHEFNCGNLGNVDELMLKVGGIGKFGGGDEFTQKVTGIGKGGRAKGRSIVNIPSGTTLVRGVIYTDCLINIGSGSTLQEVLIISENTDIASISGAAGVTFGLDDGCAFGGGSQIITLGGVHFPAKLSMYGSQIIALKTIDFEANAYGMEGVSMVSGGEIDSTSNMQMGFCNGAGLENRFEAVYFRMAR